jgi:hypothetical protein
MNGRLRYGAQVANAVWQGNRVARVGMLQVRDLLFINRSKLPQPHK